MIDPKMKILIPEIPGEWTRRTRSGSTQIFNDSWYQNGLPEVRLAAPQKGVYAERFDGAWYWICGCSKCLGKADDFCYDVCEEHDRCEDCRRHRSTLKAAVWGVRGGWRCDPCQKKRDKRLKAEALANAAKIGHSEEDCQYTDDILCPVCATKQNSDEIHDDAEGLECCICGTTYNLELHHSVSYTTTRAKP